MSINPVTGTWRSARCSSPSAPSGVLVRRNVLIMFMCVELMLNAANLAFVTFARTLHDIGGQVLVFFVLVVAAAEVVVGLGHRGRHLPAPGQRQRRRPPPDEGLTGRCSTLTYLIILLPLVGFGVLLAAGRRLGDPGRRRGRPPWPSAPRSWSRSASTSACSRSTPPVRSLQPEPVDLDPGGPAPGPRRPYVDPLSMTMVLFITGISSLIHLYSIGYMKGDKDYPKFFLYMNLFVASMLILVLGSNLLVTFVGWEGVGTCSYWLVSFWFTRDSAASAGKKAFVYNRIGDVGFLLAIFLVYDKVHSLDYQAIFANLGQIGSANITAICLLLLVGVMGKSAQIPLFPWLADAMEGPTPVSALIHAATMVTAGVYLLCRVNPLLTPRRRRP